MTDLSDAVASAVMAALAGTTLAPAFAVVPENTMPPYTALAGDTVDPTVGGKADTLERHELRLATVLAGQSKRALFAAMHEVRALLVGVPLTAVGAQLSPPVALSSDDRIDENSGLLVGEQTFLIFALAV